MGQKKIEPMVQCDGYGFDFNESLHLGAGMIFSDGAPNQTYYPLKKNWVKYTNGHCTL